MTWIIAGLVCSQTACLWYQPVGDLTYETRAKCEHSVLVDQLDDLIKFRAGESPYRQLRCRATDGVGGSAKPRRLE